MTSRGVDADVIVAGGGISGLASAWGLQQRGVRVVLLEAAPRAGGTIGTAREHGCLLESGPNSALETTPLIGELFGKIGLAGERIAARPAARKRYVLRAGRLIALPLSPLAFFATPLFSAWSKLRLFKEPFISRGARDAEESVAAFVRRRLGTEFLDYAIDPFVAGVYAGDPQTLSVKAAFPRLFELEQKHGSLILGQLCGARERARNPETSRQAAAILSFRGGMQTLTDALVRQLERVELDSELSSVLPQQTGFELVVSAASGPRHYRTRAVVLATPAPAAAQLIAPFAARAAAALRAIPYPPVAVVAGAYRRDAIAHPLDGFGFLVPQREQRRILGTLFSSTLFDHRAPQGLALLTTFVGGMRQPELALLPAGEIAELVQAELAALLGAPARAEFVRVTRWPRAIPQYTLGHLDRIACVEEAERDLPGLFFCANYRGGIAVGDCIKSAARAANQVAAFLGMGDNAP
ncbi:MAG: protoporphyrinogen oxidase [Betaproteobacteria bacterium RIFCSPLOWO2_12_FULL_62_13]|nr:MAG: protoporphyrinogen oxidase [Betaproteobacteria bacterium RIFCSPLOWO2_12_FULL_62_13]